MSNISPLGEEDVVGRSIINHSDRFRDRADLRTAHYLGQMRKSTF